ncbi:protein translocase subunit SecD [Candidatus Roizmanbacteria bacterium]|nr:protein translocase subunit SecD [Candidatus Roizmanbacteria bacterium]
MKPFQFIAILGAFFLLLWFNMPENIHLQIPNGKHPYKVTLNPPTIDLTQFGINFKREFKTKLGLDLKGGSHLVFDTNLTKVKKEDVQDALASTRDIIEKRVNFYGVSEPVVQTIKNGQNFRISVDLPGIENVSDAVRLIGQTAQLTFQEVETVPDKTQGATPAARLVPTQLTGKEVKKASVTFNQQNGQPEVALQFTETGKKLFGEITTRNVGKPLAIVVDNFILSTPTVSQPILEGNAVINGNFTVEAAKKLAISINSGTLPVPISLVQQQNIGPSLGATEVKLSLYAGIVGLGMVMAFMLFYYGRLGLIACMALIIYGLISFAIFRIIPVVLTLPGVAGFILSIGMAVDANILIFERIKEERRKGKDYATAIRLGFGRAIDAIKDANVTTLIVAFILFNPLNWDFLPQFGLVKGFALTLAIGVITSLFTGVVITKRLINIFYKPYVLKLEQKKSKTL